MHKLTSIHLQRVFNNVLPMSFIYRNSLFGNFVLKTLCTPCFERILFDVEAYGRWGILFKNCVGWRDRWLLVKCCCKRSKVTTALGFMFYETSLFKGHVLCKQLSFHDVTNCKSWRCAITKRVIFELTFFKHRNLVPLLLLISV